VSSFKFSNSHATVEVEGEVYDVNFGDPALQQDLLKFSMELATLSLNDILSKPDLYEWFSERIHFFISTLLGDEGEKRIFKGRERSILDDLELFLFLNEEINKIAALQNLDERLGRFAPSKTK
jgi:hypothetical protein